MTLLETVRSVWRDSRTFGVPASGAHEPVKVDIRALFGQLLEVLTTLGVAAGGAITVKYATVDLLEADLDHDAGTLAIVYDDDRSPSESGIYAKVGATGTGSWALTDISLPADFGTDLASALAQLEDLAAAVAAAEAAATAAELAAASAISAAGNVLASVNLAASDMASMGSLRQAVVDNPGMELNVPRGSWPMDSLNSPTEIDISALGALCFRPGAVLLPDNPVRAMLRVSNKTGLITEGINIRFEFAEDPELGRPDPAWQYYLGTSDDDELEYRDRMMTWISAWNAHYGTSISTAEDGGASFKDRWDDVYSSSPYQAWLQHSASGRQCGLLLNNCSSTQLLGFYADNVSSQFAMQGGVATNDSLFDRANYIDVIRASARSRFGGLFKKGANCRIDSIIVDVASERDTGGAPHIGIYASGEPTRTPPEKNVNLWIGSIQDTANNLGASCKLKEANVHIGSFQGDGIQGGLAMGGCTGSIGSIKMVNQLLSRTDGQPTPRTAQKYVLDMRACYDLSIGSLDCHRTPSTALLSQDDLGLLSMEDCENINIDRYSLTCTNLTGNKPQASLALVRNSHFGRGRIVNLGDEPVTLFEFSVDGIIGGSSSGNTFDPPSISGPVVVATIAGSTRSNRFNIDPTQIPGGYVEGETIVDDSFGGSNTVTIVGGERVVPLSDSPAFLTSAFATLLLNPKEDEDDDGNPLPNNLNAGDVIGIDGVDYEAVGSLPFTADGQVLIAASGEGGGVQTWKRLRAAINGETLSGSGGEGDIYQTAGVHPTFSAVSAGRELAVYSKTPGAGDNGAVMTFTPADAELVAAEWSGNAAGGGGEADRRLFGSVLSFTLGTTNKSVPVPTTALEGDFMDAVLASTSTATLDVMGVATLAQAGRRVRVAYEAGQWVLASEYVDLSEVEAATAAAQAVVDQEVETLADITAFSATASAAATAADLSEVAAGVSASAASASATSAATSASAAAAGLTYYADVAAGLAATADQGTFWVIGSGDTFASLYRDNAGSAVLLGRTAAANLLEKQQVLKLWMSASIAGASPTLILDSAGRKVNSVPDGDATASSLDSLSAAVAALGSPPGAVKLWMSGVDAGIVYTDAGGRLLTTIPTDEDLTDAVDDLEAQIDGINDSTPLTLWMSGVNALVVVLDAAGRIMASDGSTGAGAAAVTPITWSLLAGGSDYGEDTTVSLPAASVDLLLMEDGQSYTLGGYDEDPPYSFTARDPGRALMPSTGWFATGASFTSYVDLASTQEFSGTPNEPAWAEACHQLLASLDTLAGATVNTRLICWSAGQGGQRYPTLKKGSDSYNDWTVALDNCRDVSEALSRTPFPLARSLAHGESDYSTDTRVYKAAEIQRHMDRETELSDRLGRTVRVPVLAYLPMRGWNGTNKIAGSSAALRELSLEQPGRWIIYAPAYAFDHNSDQHPGNLGHRQRGAFLAHGLLRGVLGTGWRCTDFERGWVVSTTSVDLDIHVPDGGTLVEDRTGDIIGDVAGLTSAGCDGGFAVRDKDGDFNVTSAVKLSGLNRIRLTFSRAFHVGTTEVTYAMRSFSGATGGTRSTGPRGIFRADVNIPAIADSTEPLYHWLLPFVAKF